MGRYVRTAGLLIFKPGVAGRRLMESAGDGGGRGVNIFVGFVCGDFFAGDQCLRVLFFKYLAVVSRMRDLSDLSIGLRVALSTRMPVVLAVGTALGLSGVAWVVAGRLRAWC